MKQMRFATLFVIGIALVFASCGDQEPEIEPITIKEAYGLTSSQIFEYWKTGFSSPFTQDGSFPDLDR